MNTQSTEIAEEINKIVTHLKTVKGWSQKQLSAQTEDLAKLKKELTQVSTSQLSKALNYKEHNLSEGSLHKILKTLSVLQDYIQEDKPFSQHIVPQGKLRYLQGFYEMYHQSKEEQHLLKNIVEIQAESNTSGKVRIKPAHGNEIHVGRLEVFQENYVSIMIEKIGEKPFFYNILFQLSGYIDTGLELVTHFWASSTTVSLDGPMTNTRIFAPIPQENLSLDKLSPALIDMQSNTYTQLCKEKPFLEFFKNTPNRLLCNYSVNQKIYTETILSES